MEPCFSCAGRCFAADCRSIHGILDLGATGIAWMIYAFFGLLFGTAWASAHMPLYRCPVAYCHFVLVLLLPVANDSGDARLLSEQFDLGILLRFPCISGPYISFTWSSVLGCLHSVGERFAASACGLELQWRALRCCRGSR